MRWSRSPWIAAVLAAFTLMELAWAREGAQAGPAAPRAAVVSSAPLASPASAASPASSGSAAPSGSPASPAPPALAPSWPEPGAPLQAPAVEIPKAFGRHKVYVDAGHGADGNAGVASVTCEQEMDFTLRAAEDLARRLEATGHFRVRVSRKAGESVSYPRRLKDAADFGAEAIVSLHADARGMAHAWEASPGTVCWRNDETPGFSVLYSDRGGPSLNAARQSLARAVARRMALAGLAAYDGRDYAGLYLDDPAQAGAFIDRRFLYVLRKPPVPSVIVETHHFLDLQETARWQEPRTLEAFGAAVAGALVEALGRPPAPVAAGPGWTSTAN